MINNPSWLKPKEKPYFHQISMDCLEKLVNCQVKFNKGKIDADTSSKMESNWKILRRNDGVVAIPEKFDFPTLISLQQSCIYHFFLMFANLCKLCCNTKNRNGNRFINPYYFPNTIYGRCGFRFVNF